LEQAIVLEVAGRYPRVWRGWIVAAVFTFGVACAQPSPSSPERGRAVEFVASDLRGRTFRASDHYAREVIVMAFFATWSKPSTQELNHLETLRQRHAGQGLFVLGIAVDGPETTADVAGFVARHDYRFTVVLDADSHIVSLFNPKRSVPLTVLVARDGSIARFYEGYLPGDEVKLEEDVAVELRRPTAAKDTSRMSVTPVVTATP
jgi:peroxiredoxin